MCFFYISGLSPNALQFLFFMMNICVTSLTGTTVALVFSATVNNGSIGSLLTALVWTTMMVFSGLLVNIQSVPAWLRWLKWLSIFRYSMNVSSLFYKIFVGFFLSFNCLIRKTNLLGYLIKKYIKTSRLASISLSFMNDTVFGRQ